LVVVWGVLLRARGDKLVQVVLLFGLVVVIGVSVFLLFVRKLLFELWVHLELLSVDVLLV
jgi:hypothetical protein